MYYRIYIILYYCFLAQARCLQRIQSKEGKKAKGSATTAIQQTVTAQSTPCSTPSPSAPTLIQTDTAPSTPIWTPSPSASTAPSFQLQTDTAPSTPITTASPSPLTAIQTAPSSPISTPSPSASTDTALSTPLSTPFIFSTFLSAIDRCYTKHTNFYIITLIFNSNILTS